MTVFRLVRAVWNGSRFVRVPFGAGELFTNAQAARRSVPGVAWVEERPGVWASDRGDVVLEDPVHSQARVPAIDCRYAVPAPPPPAPLLAAPIAKMHVRYGVGPEDATCRSCAHLFQSSYGGVKCDQAVAGGTFQKRWPACGRYQAAAALRGEAPADQDEAEV